MIESIFWSVLIMFIWFETDAFVYYFSFLKSVQKWKKYKQETNPELNYPDYLMINYPGFFTKLISCQPCLLFWIVLLFSINNPVNFPINYVLSWILFRIMGKL